MNLWDDVSLRPGPPQKINVIVEIPSNIRNKYEFDHELGIMRQDRALSAALHYPVDYGLIPQTLYDDGDPPDVLVLIKKPTFAGFVVTARPIGLFRMDDRNDPGDKILAVADIDSLYRDFQGLDDVAALFQEGTARFSSHY